MTGESFVVQGVRTMTSGQAKADKGFDSFERVGHVVALGRWAVAEHLDGTAVARLGDLFLGLDGEHRFAKALGIDGHVAAIFLEPLGDRSGALLARSHTC